EQPAADLHRAVQSRPGALPGLKDLVADCQQTLGRPTPSVGVGRCGEDLELPGRPVHDLGAPEQSGLLELRLREGEPVLGDQISQLRARNLDPRPLRIAHCPASRKPGYRAPPGRNEGSGPVSWWSGYQD